MNLFSAFIESLCSVNFYKKVIASSLSKGFQYLLLWSGFASVLIFLFVLFRAMPEINEFTAWFKDAAPVVTWTPEAGVSIDRPSPYEMRHPKYGHIMTFDTGRKEISNEEVGTALVFVTSAKVYTKEPNQQTVKVYDVLPQDNNREKAEKIIIDRGVLEGFERKAKPVILFFSIFGSFIFFFVWKLLVAVFYSIAGNIINNSRQEKLPYEAVLNVTIFAMTASFWIGFTVFFISDVVRVPFGFFGSFLVTSIYLFMGLKVTENPEVPEDAGDDEFRDGE